MDVRDAWREAEDFAFIAGNARIGIFDCWTPVWGFFTFTFCSFYLSVLCKISSVLDKDPSGLKVLALNKFKCRGAFACSQEIKSSSSWYFCPIDFFVNNFISYNETSGQLGLTNWWSNECDCISAAYHWLAHWAELNELSGQTLVYTTQNLMFSRISIYLSWLAKNIRK